MVSGHESDSLAVLLESQQRSESSMDDLARRLDVIILSHSQNKGHSSRRSKDPICYLHRIFGDKAHYCQPPCSFMEKPKPKPGSLRRREPIIV